MYYIWDFLALFTSPCDSFGHNMFAVHNYNNEPEINTRGIKYAAYVGAQLICGIRGRGAQLICSIHGLGAQLKCGIRVHGSPVNMWHTWTWGPVNMWHTWTWGPVDMWHTCTWESSYHPPGGTFGCQYDSPPPRMICKNMLGLTNGGSNSYFLGNANWTRSQINCRFYSHKVDRCQYLSHNINFN